MVRSCVVAAVLAGAVLNAGEPSPDWLIFHQSRNAGSGVWIAHGSKTRAIIDGPGVQFVNDAGSMIRVELVGASRGPQFSGERQAGSFTRISGAKRNWSAQAWQAIECRDIYPGIHLKYSGARGSLKSEYYVEEGASPSLIRLKYAGAKTTLENGDLILKAQGGVLREHKPEVFQLRDGQRIHVLAKYRIHADGTVGFEVGPYDSALPLIIDPQMDFSTVWGGALSDAITGVAFGSDGAIYAAGWTASADMLTTASLQQSPGGSMDAFVVKISATGTLVYATYVGGAGYDKANGLAVDSAGAVYLTGLTDSTDFPLVSEFQSHVAGAHDAFVLKLDPTGKSLVYSTLIGGTGNDQGNAIAVDGTGAAYVAGETDSGDFPTAAAYQAKTGGGTDGFVLKLQPAGARAYATHLGGYGTDRALAIAVRNGEVYVTGTTDSPNFPTQSALQSAIHGTDAFVTKLNAAGSGLVYSTFLGGTDGASSTIEMGFGIAVNSAGEAYVTGVTASTDFPTVAALQALYGGGSSDAFVAKLNAAGSALLFSTFIGGLGMDKGESIALDPDGNAYIGGTTFSSNFPCVAALSGTRGGTSDAFMTAIEPGGSGMFFSTYWGGLGAEASVSVAARQGAVVIGGQTQSVDFVLNGAVAPRNAGASGFLTRFAIGQTTAAITVTSSPAGRAITVDGTSYTAPQSFQWRLGTSHTICTTSPQSGTAQTTRYAWGNWSDGGPMCHDVTAQTGTSTYTAAFTTQYQLLTAANPSTGGAVSPASGNYYDAGTSVSISATANPLYTFTSWSGDASGTSSSTSVVMSSAKTVTASFAAGGPSISITSPTSAGTWSATASPLSMSGSAASVNAISQVTWSNDRGGSGTAAGTTNWSASVPLVAGTNTVTVTVRDSAGATRSASLVVSMGSAPAAFTLTAPANAASSVSTGIALTWSPSTGVTSYDVYVGTTNPPAMMGSATAATYTPAALAASTTYYWKVVAKNAVGSTASPVWSFTTAGSAPTGSGGMAFYPVSPCRVVDTRDGQGTSGEFGPPIFRANQARTFHLNSGRCSGLPNAPGAYSLNITVVPVKILNYLAIWPHGQPQPFVSTLNSLSGGVVANSAIVPAGPDGTIDVFVTDDTHVIIDVNGYFGN